LSENTSVIGYKERLYTGRQVPPEVSVQLARSRPSCFAESEVEVLTAALDQGLEAPTTTHRPLTERSRGRWLLKSTSRSLRYAS
ncbi:MAG: hypothetical protein ABIP46_12310, partial [Polaromonas sp.]